MGDFDQKRWDELFQLKQMKMKEQKELAAGLGRALNDQDGLIENSRRTMKNLDAAIVASKQPGYFKYHEPGERVKNIEDRHELKRFNQRIRQVQKEIDQASQEMKEMDRRRKKGLDSGELPAISGLSQWFAQYGGKPNQTQNGMMSTISQSTKIYGGTRHHPAFRSVHKPMKKGRAFIQR